MKSTHTQNEANETTFHRSTNITTRDNVLQMLITQINFKHGLKSGGKVKYTDAEVDI